MKTIFFLTILTLTITAKSNRDCSITFSSAEDAYSYYKKVFESNSWDDSNNYLKKAMNSFEDALA